MTPTSHSLQKAFPKKRMLAEAACGRSGENEGRLETTPHKEQGENQGGAPARVSYEEAGDKSQGRSGPGFWGPLMCYEAVGCRKPEGDSLGLKPGAEFCHLFWPQEREHNLIELS